MFTMRIQVIACRLATVLALLTESAAPAQEVGKPRLEGFYRPDQVQSVRLRIAEEDLQRMAAALPKRIYVRGSFEWGKIVVENVAVRYKGNSSSAPQQQHKRSFLIKFNEYDSEQRFLGMRRASLDNGVQFGSVFSEPIITDILRQEGVVAHRCNYAKLYLNDKYMGVYVNVERIDESFVEQQLPDAKGLLFKVDQGGPGADLRYLGEDAAAYGRTFAPETKAAKRGSEQLVGLLRLIKDAPAEKLAARLEMDAFLRTAAVLLFSGAFDQLTGWNPHNYYLYHDGKADRWRYLPWDLDVGFCDNAFGRIRVLAEWNAAWPVAGQRGNPLMERIVTDPELLKRYRSGAKVILEKYFEPEKLCAVIDAKYALIREDLKTDPFPHRRITNPGDRDYDGIVESMKAFVRARYASAREQLENPGERPAMTPMAAGPEEFGQKIQRIMRGAQRMQENGKSVAAIQRVMQQVGPLLQAGRMEEAGRLIDQALKLVGEE
jgi:spore coat protein CotH